MNGRNRPHTIKELELMFDIHIPKSTFTDDVTGVVTETLYTEEEKELTIAPYWMKGELENRIEKNDES